MNNIYLAQVGRDGVTAALIIAPTPAIAASQLNRSLRARRAPGRIQPEELISIDITKATQVLLIEVP